MATSAEGRAPGKGLERRIVGVWLGLLLLAALVASAWHSGGSRLRDTGATGPWIGMPPGGSDLADVDARRIVAAVVAAGAPADDLLMDCAGAGGEKYQATVTDAHGRNGWRILFIVQGEEIIAQGWRGAFPAPAPPGLAPIDAQPRPSIVRELRRGELDPVREAWRTASLWGDDPGEPFGVDGHPTRLEACIDGRYAIRQRQASNMGERLHAALVRALALPVPPASTH